MAKIVGVRFKKNGKTYYFGPGSFELKVGDHVIVETVRGVEYGEISIAEREASEEEIVSPLKDIIRIATEEDDRIYEENKVRAKEAFPAAIEKIKKHGLEMKLIDIEYTFDNSKMLFYFTADGRIDFRELVKDLASVFKIRIELRQVGVRDEAKIVGGLGVCGRPCCCNACMGDFQPVSIKMAKEQGLSLSPTKISGTCGRLMCCLNYEQGAYEDAIRRVPGVGSLVETKDGKGNVVSSNLISEKVQVKFERGNETELITYKIDDIKVLSKKKGHYSSAANSIPSDGETVKE